MLPSTTHASTETNGNAIQDGPVLLYDGECGVCNFSVQWILRHERNHGLRFAPVQSSIGERLRRQAGISNSVDSLLWMEATGDGVRASVWSSAVLRVVEYVGGPWRWLAVFRIVPRPLRDGAYRLFARHRRRFAPTACLLPPPETRTRFLDI